MILSPIPKLYFQDNNGRPLVGGQLFTYVAGTSTKIDTYTDESGGTPNTNPVILDFRGECNVWLDPLLTYKFVLAPRDDTDPPTKPIWTVDNISPLGGLTPEIIGQLIWPRSAREIAAGITPVSFAHPWGAYMRYGADPAGLSDSSTAISNAIACNDEVFDDYPGGGTYKLNSEVVISSFPCKIRGSGANPNLTSSGTTFRLMSVAGAGAAHFKTAAAIPNIEWEDMTISHETTTTGQIGIRLGSDSRYCRAKRVAFMSAGGVASTAVGIQSDGTGTYSAFLQVMQCYFSGHKYGIDLRGTNTVVDIVDSDFVGYSTATACYALKCSNLSSYTIRGGHIEGYNTANSRGIYSEGGFCVQFGIRYEVNTVNWEWVRGSGNARIWGMAFAERFISGGNPIYPLNDVDACMVFTGPGFCDIDTTDLSVYRGYYENGRTERLGNYNAITFNAADFLANAGGSWTLTSPDQVTYLYRLIANSLDIIAVFRNTTIVGGPTQLIFTLPQTSAVAATVPCFVNNAGTRVIGYATIAAASNLVAVQLVGGGAFTAGANNSDVELQMSVQI